MLDKAQHLIKTELGEKSEKLPPVYEELAIVCNMVSMTTLSKNDLTGTLELLKKAEFFAEGNDRIKAMVYNNYACVFRKTNKVRNALSYLEMALDLEYKMLN